MSRGPDAGTLLERALVASAARADRTIRIAAADCTRWASVTFAGARHKLTLAADTSSALDAWLAALPEEEFVLRGHLVADLTVESVRREGERMSILLEVLTVEER